MKKHLLTIIGLALVATAANAQTITDALRHDQKGQGKVVVNQSADIERLVNNRQAQTTTNNNNTQSGKPAEKSNNQQQVGKTNNPPQTNKSNNQPQTTKSNQNQERTNQNKQTNTATDRGNNTPQHQVNGSNNNATQHPAEKQQDRNNNATERQPERQDDHATERQPEHQNDRATERPTEHQTERPATRQNYGYDYDTSASVNTNKKIMRHSYKTTGYRIQVYTGGNKRADRTKCEQIAARLKTAFPSEPIYVHFYSPSWKCRLGNFTSMSEAKTCLRQVRRMGYNQACIVKGTISVQY